MIRKMINMTKIFIAFNFCIHTWQFFVFMIAWLSLFVMCAFEHNPVVGVSHVGYLWTIMWTIMCIRICFIECIKWYKKNKDTDIIKDILSNPIIAARAYRNTKSLDETIEAYANPQKKIKD